MKLRIGIDIDGCIYPWSQAVNEYIEDEFGYEPIGDHEHWDHLEERISKEHWDSIWTRDSAPEVFGRLDLIYPGAAFAVDQLCQEHEVHFVTHRNPHRTTDVTGQWIRYHFRNYCGIHVVTNRCRKASLGHWDVFIDDKPQTVLEFVLDTQTKVLVPRRPWNAQIHEAEGLTMFDDWADVPGLITNHLEVAA